MVIRVLTFQLAVPGAKSLKDKRMAVRSLKDRLRARFNVSVAETALQDVWTRAELTVVFVAGDRRQADRTEAQVDRLVETDGRLALLSATAETH